jgi:hypothetical protein
MICDETTSRRRRMVSLSSTVAAMNYGAGLDP